MVNEEGIDEVAVNVEEGTAKTAENRVDKKTEFDGREREGWWLNAQIKDKERVNLVIER